MIIDNSLITKSIAYGGRYTSETFNSHHKVLFGNNFVVSGFALIDINESVGLSITLGPGVFCTSGIVVQITSDTSIVLGESPTTPKLLVASTEDNSKDSPVSVDLLSPTDVTDKMTVIGYFTPQLSFAESIDTGAYGDTRRSFYRPAAHHSLTEMASDVSSGIKTESILGTDVYANSVGSNYRVESKGIPFASEDPNLLVFYRGSLLEEDTHYIIESPGTLLIKGSTNLVREDGTEKTLQSSYAESFIDLIYAPDFMYRQTYAFLSPEAGEDYILSIPQKFSEEFSKGVFEPLVFVSSASGIGSTLLGSDRYVPVITHSASTSRDSIRILPREYHSTSSSGYVSDEKDFPSIASFTVIGVRGLNAGIVLEREEADPPSLPIVDGNSVHSALTNKYMETRIPYKVESGDMQVFVDGRLSPCDHFTVNNMHPDAAPDLSDTAGQRYVSDKNSSAIEIGTIPIKYSTEHGIAHDTNTEFKVIDTINFRPNYLSPKTRDLTYGSSTFSGLKEAKDTPGITEALFNATGDRYFDTGNSQTFEFSDNSALAFNGNYFVTYQSLAGISSSVATESSSLFQSLTMSVSMFYDVPLGVGLSLEAAHQLNFAKETGTFSDGWFYEDATTDRKDPLAADGSPMVGPQGLYNIQIDPDNYFSENNPIVTYAALDAHLQPWMDSFGFFADKDAPRDYLRNAGVTYDADGNTLTSFSNLMGASFVEPNLSLVEVIESISRNISSSKTPIATANGYAYGGRIINLSKGKIVPALNPKAGIDTDDIFPSNTGLNHGIYTGHIAFESPFKTAWTSSAINTHNLTYASDSNYGIFSIPTFGGTNKIGESSFTGNNLTCIISPIPAGGPGFNHNNDLMMARYRFVHLDPNTEGAIIDDPVFMERNFSEFDPPDIGIEIVAVTNGGGPGASGRNALVQWTVFGKLDSTADKHTHTSVDDEFWFDKN